MAYPTKKLRYRVKIDGGEVGKFSELSGFDTSIDTMGDREGDRLNTPSKISGLTKYGNVTLKQGVIDSTNIYDWITTSVRGFVERKTVTIVLLDEEEAAVASWQMMEAWPVRSEWSDYQTTASEIAVESIEFAYESLKRVS